jgi:hypothetical protein
MKNSVKPHNEMTTSYASENDIYGDNSLRLENRRFTYKELKIITNNFQQVLGQGGFGYVYNGFLDNGTQVAVKLRSHSSSQGVKEFLAEVEFLSLTKFDVSEFKFMSQNFRVKFDVSRDFYRLKF